METGIYSSYIMAILIALAILSIIANPFFRFLFLKKHFRQPERSASADEVERSDLSVDDPNDQSSLSQELTTSPPLSIVIPVDGNIAALRKSLPLFLSQDYPSFRLIFVIDKYDHDAEAAIAEVGQDRRIYTTFLPDSTRYMSRKKLAITIGIKAAQTDWVLIADPTNMPTDSHWLENMAEYMTSERKLVLNYSNYDGTISGLQRFKRLKDFMYTTWEIIRSGQAYQSTGTLVAIRKKDFMDGEGFVGNLHLLRGEYDALVNRYSSNGGVALATSPHTFTFESEITAKALTGRHLFRFESAKVMQRKLAHRWKIVFDDICFMAYHAALLGTLVYGLLLHDIPVLATVAATIICTLTANLLTASIAIRTLRTQIPLWLVPFYVPCLFLSSFYYFVYHRLTDKNEFTSHKL